MAAGTGRACPLSFRLVTSASRTFASLAFVGALFAGCGDRVSTPSPDGGLTDADLPTPGLVDIPWLAAGSPTITPSPARVCPAGFRETHTDTGVQLCDPWAATGPLDCGGSSAQFPGEAACAPIGTACPAGEWPEGLPTDRPIVYVRAGAAGGSGTLAAPYGDPQLAVTRAPVGAVIALSRGTYTGRLELFSGVTVWGACPDETVLTTSDVGESEVVVGAFLGGSQELRNVTVRVGTAMGIYVDGGSTLRLQDVIVDGASGYGLYVTAVGSVAQLEDVVIRNVSRFPSGNAGIGAQIVDGATASFHRVALDNNVEGHLVVAFDSVATVDYLSAHDASGIGSTGPRPGTAVAVQMGGHLILTASSLDHNESGGILVAQGAQLEATDIAIRDTGDVGTSLSSPGLEVRVGSTATVVGALIERARGAAMILSEDGALDLSDSAIMDTRASLSADNSGLGATVEGTAHLSLARVLVDHARRGGIISRDTAVVDATDVVVRDTEPAGPRGLGLGMGLFGRATLTRVLVERSTSLGVGVSGDGSTLDAHDLVVRDTRSDSPDGFYGRGLEANLGAQVTGDRVLLERNREVSTFAFDPGTRMHLSNLVIRDSLAETCGASCPSGGLGHGATVLSGATLELAGFVIARSALLGVQVGLGGSFTGTRGEISAGPIGLNIQDPAFDLATSLTDVSFRELERSVDTTVLPIPDTGLSGP